MSYYYWTRPKRFFSYGAAPGWKKRSHYPKTGAIPFGSKDCMDGFRYWRFANKFEELHSRLVGNYMGKSGDLYCPYRARIVDNLNSKQSTYFVRSK